eukprot:ANDGO_05709.mRNA.1 Pescadillo homolog
MVSAKKKSIPRPTGTAPYYMTRNEALRKLQVSLKDFRRLCILKGVFPRDPPKKKSGKDKVYYAVKDITYLAHEPILAKFRDLKAWMKKYRRAVGRKEENIADRLTENKPMYTLDHLIRERYPTFESALADLDDALSLVHLFARLPSTASIDREKHVVPCEQLVAHWQFITTRMRALQKCFVAVKGVYYQAHVRGQAITYIVPHETAQQNTAEGLVDYKILLTFLEFYTVLTKFVLFRLFKDQGLQYPPVADLEQGTSFSHLQVVERQDSTVHAGAAEDEDGAVGANGVAQAASVGLGTDGRKSVFEGLRVAFGRECPCQMMELLIRGAGGIVDEKGATHVVVDRPALNISVFPQLSKRFNGSVAEMSKAVEIVQPQWIVDSFNWNFRLPVSEFALGKPLPPHLSPFVDYEKEGYVPERYKELLRITQGASAASAMDLPSNEENARRTKPAKVPRMAVAAKDGAASRKRGREDDSVGVEDEVVVDADSSDDEDVQGSIVDSSDDEIDEDEDLEIEGELKDALPDARQLKAEERERRKLMLPRKKQKLYNAMQMSQEKKRRNVEKLVKKAKIAKSAK